MVVMTNDGDLNAGQVDCIRRFLMESYQSDRLKKISFPELKKSTVPECQ